MTLNYFPPEAFDARPNLHAHRAKWYVSHLGAMHEESLFPAVVDQPSQFRLLYLPTFSRPMVVRIVDREPWRVICKITTGQGGYEPGELCFEWDRILTAAEARRMKKLVKRADFWNLPSYDECYGLDGFQCVIEGTQHGAYHVVDRWSPDGTHFADLVEFLLGLFPSAGADRSSGTLRSFAELREVFLRTRSNEDSN